jgi:molybdopterin converting factor small subunit
MPTFHVPALMKYYVDNQTDVHVSGGTIAQALDNLTDRYPSIKTHIIDSQGRLRRHVNLFVNKENIRTLDGIDTVVKENDKIILMSSISGG